MKWVIEEYGEFIILFLVCSSILTFFFGMLTVMPDCIAGAYDSEDHSLFIARILEVFSGGKGE